MGRLRPMAAVSGLLAWLAPAAALAQEKAPVLGEDPSMGLALVKMLAALGLVLGLLLVAYWALRRFTPLGRAAGAASGGLRLLGRLPLGGKAWLSVVEAGGEVLIVGVTEQSVNLLARVEDPEQAARLRAAGPGGFGRALRRAAGRDQEDEA